MSFEVVNNSAVGGGASWGSYDAGANAAALGDPALIAAVALQDPTAFGGGGPATNDGSYVGGAWSPEPAGNNAIFDGSYSASGGLTVPRSFYGGYPTAANPLAASPAPAPAAEAAKKPAAAKPVADRKQAAPETVTVKSGDSLTAIAAREGVDWKELYELNRDVVGANPNLIRPGQQLKLP